jgi:C4-dicarboxylate transporter DctM subunit
MAIALGIDPLHLGINFIVNLEIGYLTPPVGLNLFVASTLFDKPLTYLVRAVLPFIGLMSIGLLVITYVPALSVDLGRWISGSEPRAAVPEPSGELEDEPDVTQDATPTGPRPACDPPEDLNCDGTVTIEEMTEYVSE